MKSFQTTMVVIMVQDIGYGWWIYDNIFSEENTYNAYVASLLNDDGVEKEIVGYIMLELSKKESEPYSYIQGLYVEEKYRNRGIAKRLINEAENYSKSVGAKGIEAEMRFELFEFYNKLGFSIYKKKNDSTYRISKDLEKNKEMKKDDDWER